MTSARRLVGYMRPYVGSMSVSALAVGVAGALLAVVVATLKPLVNDVLLGGTGGAVPPPRPGGSFDILSSVLARLPLSGWAEALRQRAFVAVPLLLVVTILARGLFLYLGQYGMARAGASVIRDIRVDLFRAVAFQSPAFFRQHPTGTVLSRVLHDVQRLHHISTNTLADIVRFAAMVPFLIALAVVHDWRTALFALLVLPLTVYPTLRLGRRIRRASRSSQSAIGDAADLLSETVRGIKVVQAFGVERFEVERFRGALGRALRVDLRAARAASLGGPVVELMAACAGAVLFFFAGRGIARGHLDPGDFFVVVTSLGLLFVSMRRFNRANAELQQALSAADRAFEMIDAPVAVRDSPGAVEMPPFAREIRFEGVTFAYEEEPVLRDLSLTVRRGELVALVGPSGAGKTTLVNLLLRFFDPRDGRITLDGSDLRRLTLASLRRQIGLVTQETVLFNDTVRANIAYGRDDVPLERVTAAARAAHAEAFIAQLPAGYDTVIGEGGLKLSMGQRQRITIARALLKDPPILVLDEATSALDSESEALVQQALEVLLAGRTSIVIAHRLATVRRADRIVVLDAGRIVETGTHRELRSKGGLYARLCELQFGDDVSVAEPPSVSIGGG